jgi:hypothetical protein
VSFCTSSSSSVSKASTNLQFSPRNGVLLLDALEDDYEKNRWFFDHDGKVTVLFPNWPYKDTIRSVNISKDPKIGPSKDLIDMHKPRIFYSEIFFDESKKVVIVFLLS